VSCSSRPRLGDRRGGRQLGRRHGAEGIAAGAVLRAARRAGRGADRRPPGRARLARRRQAPRLGGVGSAVGSLFGALALRAISFNFRIFEVDPLLQPLIEGMVLLGAVSLGAVRVLRVRNTLDLFR